jgi:hypothetical protein
VTESDALTDQDLPVQDGALSAAEGRRRSNLQLAAGVLVFLAASAAVLVIAGDLGVGGVFLAALIEAAAIAWLYRWCEA